MGKFKCGDRVVYQPNFESLWFNKAGTITGVHEGEHDDEPIYNIEFDAITLGKFTTYEGTLVLEDVKVRNYRRQNFEADLCVIMEALRKDYFIVDKDNPTRKLNRDSKVWELDSFLSNFKECIISEEHPHLTPLME